MSKKSFTGSLNLSALQHSIKELKGKSGLLKCLVIPIELNMLIEGKNGALYLNIGGQISDEPDKYENNGFIAARVPAEIYKDASDEEKESFKKLPILGNIKFWGKPETVNEVEMDLASEEDNDLPF